MEKTLFDLLLNIPSYVATFTDWLMQPLPYVNISPLGLFGIGGGAVIIAIIGFHLLHLVIG